MANRDQATGDGGQVSPEALYTPEIIIGGISIQG